MPSKFLLCGATFLVGLLSAQVAVADTRLAVFPARSSLQVHCDNAKAGQAIHNAQVTVPGQPTLNMKPGNLTTITNQTGDDIPLAIVFTYLDSAGNWLPVKSAMPLWQDNHIQKFDVQDTGAGVSYYCTFIRN
jgi:hypothetical protein